MTEVSWLLKASYGNATKENLVCEDIYWIDCRKFINHRLKSYNLIYYIGKQNKKLVQTKAVNLMHYLLYYYLITLQN